MGTGTKYYCLCCHGEFDDYQIDPDTGWCWKCLDIKNIGIDCPQCGNAVKESEIIWLNYEERIPDCCFDCENLARRGM